MKEIKLICKPLVAINGEIFEKGVVLYEYQKVSQKVFNLTSKSDSDCKVSLQIDGEQAYFLLNDKNEEIHVLDDVTLKSKETLEIPIYLKPGAKCGENPISIKAITDFSSLVGKKFTIKTKKSISPKPLFDFAYIDGDVYYIGEGNRKMGTLTITASKQEGGQNTDAYRALDLRDLKCSCEFIGIEPLGDANQTLSLGDSKTYDVYFNTNKKEDVTFNFSVGAEKSKKFTIQVKPQSDPLKMEFVPIEKLGYDLLKIDHIVGYLHTDFTDPRSKRGYYNRNNGCFELTDQLHSFDNEGKTKKQELEYGKKKYPVYADIEGLFGSMKENIDEDKRVIIDNLLFSDSITDIKRIEAEYTIKHIEASPISCISVIDLNGNISPILEQEAPITLEEWKYVGVDASQIYSDKIFDLCLSNRQPLPYNGNGILWVDIRIKGDEIIEQNIPRVEVRNGEQEAKIPINVKFDKIKNKSEIKVSFKCKEYINDADRNCNNPHEINCTIVVPIIEVVVDDWYSIDLGTTGIVVAKWDYKSKTSEFDGISAIKLDDSDKPIESNENILSSITIIKPSSDDKDIGEIVLAPSTTELKQSDNYVLVPTKFMVGQESLPFISTYRKRFPRGLYLDNEKYDWNDITPEKIIEYTYKAIFRKISEDECGKIRKLIVTYPNTYTPKSLDWLRNMIIESRTFKNLSPRNLHFIPESDSVVAYYANKSMKRTTNETEENVVIYDMGAGTLDLSYVKIFMDEQERIKRFNIEKRIGIPIAGEYFSYLIYEQFKDNFVEGTKANYTTRSWVENFKKRYGTFEKLKDVNQGDETIIKSECADNESELGSTIDEWIKICTEDILLQLFDNDADWGRNVHRIVFSGRGSQFKPIQDKLKELTESSNIILDSETISVSELKQCVAEGAILYQKIFENSSMPFSILHRNSYERIGIKYCMFNDALKEKWVYRELMTNNNLVWDECPKDGAIFAQVPELKIEDLDFRPDHDIVFYLTTLDNDTMQHIIDEPNSKKEAFINELFRFKHVHLTNKGDLEHSVINLSIDLDNVLKITINSVDLMPHLTLPNVEDDKFYIKCNWFFNH